MNNEILNIDEELDNIIVLNDENGNEVNFEFLDLIEYSNEEFVILLPCDNSDEAAEVVILKVEDIDSDEESYVSVDDENVLNVVFQIFKDKHKDEFNFLDNNTQNNATANTKWTKDEEKSLFELMRQVKFLNPYCQKAVIHKCEFVLCDECSGLTHNERLNIVYKGLVDIVSGLVGESNNDFEVNADNIDTIMGISLYYMEHDNQDLASKLFKMVNTILK